MTDASDSVIMRSRSRIGRVLREKWRIDELLGTGGMASVYAATHVNNGRRVAIKVLHTELSMNQELRGRFLREGYVANKVEHQGSVAVLDDDIADDGAVFLVMELLEGETLDARVARSGGTLRPSEIISTADAILDVLACAHDRGIVHRDIKPDNVFLTRDGRVKLLDFGIARIRDMSGVRQTMTNAGAMGTPAFLPPEQARGRWDDVGPRSDIWALGATMFTISTGRLVHQAETLNELLLAAMTNPAPSLASLLPAFPPPLAAVIDRALAYDFNSRWPNARSMQAALRQAHETMQRVAAAVPHFKSGGTIPMPQFTGAERSPAARAHPIQPAAGAPPRAVPPAPSRQPPSETSTGPTALFPDAAGDRPATTAAATANTLLARPSESSGPPPGMQPPAAEPSGLFAARAEPAAGVSESSGLTPAPGWQMDRGAPAAAPFAPHAAPVPGHAVATTHPVTMAGLVPEGGRTRLGWAIIAAVVVTLLGLVGVLVLAWRAPAETTSTPPTVVPPTTEQVAPAAPPATVTPLELPVAAPPSTEPAAPPSTEPAPVPAASATSKEPPTSSAPSARPKTKSTGQPRKERDLLNRQH